MATTTFKGDSNITVRPSQDTAPHATKNTRKHGSALRMISTNDMDEDIWLKYRQQGIGSSDAATACGLNPFKSQLELWMEKTGRLSQDQPNILEDSPLVWGTILEPVVAEHYAKRTGKKVKRVNSILQSTEHPWMLANLDRQIVGDDDVQILECKTAGMYTAKHWDNGVPEYIQLQVQHQLAVTGQDAADVAVLIGGQKLSIFRVKRDDVLIKHLIQLEALFWKRVENNTPPPADASSSAEHALRRLYPNSNGNTIDLSTNQSANSDFSELLSIRKQITALSAKENLLKHRLMEKIGDHSTALLSEGKISWKVSKPSMQLDRNRLKSKEPELFKKFLIPKEGTRRFLIQPS